MGKAVIFDADDTLWHTDELYENALARIQTKLNEVGYDGDMWRTLQREIDLEQVKTMGFSPARFPSSSVQALHRLDPTPDPGLVRVVETWSTEVFYKKAALAKHVVHTLILLEDEYRLGLLTKGDQMVQSRRIKNSRLGHFFSATAIVADKNQASFVEMCARLGADPSQTVSVGNSLRSDIIPAVTAGCAGVWIDTKVWEHERANPKDVPKGVIRLKSLKRVPAAVAELSRRRTAI